MNKIEKILIAGLGAIGSIYATTFKSLDFVDVKVLADESRIEKYKKNGLIFNEKRYDFDYVLPYPSDFKADLILIAVKANDLSQVIADIKNFVGENTIIVSLLNGITSEEQIAQQYGWEKLLYSFYIGHASMRQGLRVTYDGVGKIVFGDAQNIQLSDKVLAFKELLDQTSLDYEIPQDMLSEMWKKFTVNIGINQTSAALGADYSVLQKLPQAHKLAQSLMEEAVLVANAVGVKNTETFISTAFALINNMPPNLKPSMLQDVEAKRQTEIDILAKTLCEIGRKYNVSTPQNEMIAHIISSLDLLNFNVKND
jgi:2-dehydropantoate 2-reductase